MTTSPGAVIQQIWSGLIKDFTTAEAWITGAIARVEAVLPGAAPVAADLKQAASDALGVIANAATTYEPAFVGALEVAADAAITTVAGPYAQPLNQLANQGIQDVVTKGKDALDAWALKVQAQFAENTAAKGGGTAAPAA